MGVRIPPQAPIYNKHYFMASSSSKYPVECSFCGVTDEFLNWNIIAKKYLCDYCARFHYTENENDMIVYCDRCGEEVSVHHYPNKEYFVCPMCETETASILTYIEFQMMPENDPAPLMVKSQRASEYITNWLNIKNSNFYDVIKAVSEKTGIKPMDIVAQYAARYDWHCALDRVMQSQEEIVMHLYQCRIHDMLAKRNGQPHDRVSEFIKEYPMTICPIGDDLARNETPF
jgi:hypothetical protein